MKQFECCFPANGQPGVDDLAIGETTKVHYHKEKEPWYLVKRVK